MRSKNMNVHFNFVMDDETFKMLDELSDKAQRSRADYLRILITNEWKRQNVGTNDPATSA